MSNQGLRLWRAHDGAINDLERSSFSSIASLHCADRQTTNACSTRFRASPRCAISLTTIGPDLPGQKTGTVLERIRKSARSGPVGR